MTRPIIQINDVVRPMNDEEYAEWLSEQPERDAQQAAAVRAERNSRLVKCDWTQLPDAPVDHQPWLAYRQQLRDVTSQPGFPWTIEWPPQP
ncbi:MAG: tail fiber assembly protein [bacterium]|jgi:hypothetical protein